MLLFHLTYDAAEIVTRGFRQRDAPWTPSGLSRGVLLSELDFTSGIYGANGDVMLKIDIPDERLQGHEWKEESLPCRVFFIPWEVANVNGPPTVHDHELGHGTREQFMRYIELFESSRQPSTRERGARLRKLMPFLETHGVVIGNSPVPAVLPAHCGGCSDKACCLRMGRPPFRKMGIDGYTRIGEPLPPGMPADLIREAEGWFNDGVVRSGSPCLWLDQSTKLCAHYQFRPFLCRDFDCQERKRERTGATGTNGGSEWGSEWGQGSE